METMAGKLKGHFLMAMPGLLDPNFQQTVTVICEHNQEGALGLVVNRPHSFITCEEVFKELNIDHAPSAASVPVHIGGPVHSGEIFVLHGPPFSWEACLMINATLAMSNSIDIIEAVAKNRGPHAFVMCLGCAGWGPGQLEAELRDNAWLTIPARDDIIFGGKAEKRWEQSVRLMGIDPSLLSSTAGNA
jgi:putative transcriptional regulator